MVKTKPNQFKGFLNYNAIFLMVFVLMNLSLSQRSDAQINSVASGTVDWSNPTSWVGGVVPGAGQAVVIQLGCTMRVNVNTAVVGNITVNGWRCRYLHPYM